MKKTLGDPVIKFFISVLGLVVIFSVLKELQHIFIPFIIAYFFFFVFEPFNEFLRKKKIPYSIAIFADIVIIAGAFYGIGQLIVGSFDRFSQELPLYEQKLNNLISSAAYSLGISDPNFTQFNLSQTLQDLNYGGVAGDFFTSTLSFFSTLFFVLFFFIFVSSGHAKIVEAIKQRYVERKIRSSVKKIKKQVKKETNSNEQNNITIDNKVNEIKSRREVFIENTFKRITEQVQRYIITKFFISLLTGVITGLILWIFDVDFFIVWAVITLLLNFIPNIGSIIAVILPTIVTLIQYESFGFMLVVFAILVGVQALIGNILEPKIFGDRLGLNPLVILISLLLWGYIWGIVGMFISVPLTAIAKIIMENSDSDNLTFIANLMDK